MEIKSAGECPLEETDPVAILTKGNTDFFCQGQTPSDAFSAKRFSGWVCLLTWNEDMGWCTQPYESVLTDN